MNELAQILTIALIQSSYDFAGWFIWLGEKHGNIRDYTWKEWFFRTVKLILDYPVTIYLLLNAGFDIKFISAFYVFKRSGGVDFIYLLMKIAWTNQKMFDTADWFHWTPYGAYRRLQGEKQITNYEFLIQVTIGIIVSLIILIL